MSATAVQETTTAASKPRRQRRFRGKKANPTTEEKDEEKAGDNVASDATRKNRGRPTRDAPEVATEPREPREPLKPVDGLLELRVSNLKPRIAYCRIARLYLSGADSAGNKLETGDVNKIKLTALGGAIGTAIYVSDDLVKSQVCVSASVETEFAEVEGRKAPKITIVLARSPSWVPADDAVLQKDRVYRKAKGLAEPAPTEEQQAA